MNNNKVPAVNFIGTMMANVDNEKMSDADFRQFIRNTLPILEKPTHDSIVNKEVATKVKKYYDKSELGLQAKVELLQADLDKYFKGTYIKKYRVESAEHGVVVLRPIKPEFDEDYDNDEMDEDIKRIGLKYDLDVSWDSDIYGK